MYQETLPTTMNEVIESFEEYLAANEKLVEMMHLNPEPGTDEHKDSYILKDQILTYETSNFPVFYPNSPYHQFLIDHRHEIEEMFTSHGFF